MRPITLLAAVLLVLFQQEPVVPSSPLAFGVFSAHFAADGIFTLDGQGWPGFRGTWKAQAGEIEIATPDAAGGGDHAGPDRFTIARAHVRFDLVSDACMPRRMILDHSTWRPSGEVVPVPERKIVRTAASARTTLPVPSSGRGSWPSFRGRQASGIAEGMNLPDTWDGAKGD